MGQFFPNSFNFDGLETLLEKSIECFIKNVSEIESAIAQDADVSQLQKLDESLSEAFWKIKSFQSDNQRLRQIQLNFFLDYISKISEDPLVSELAETTKGLVDRYTDEADKSDLGKSEGIYSSNENIGVRL